MDMIHELKLLNSKGMSDAFEYVKSQKELWDKKMHIFNVLNLAHELEKWKTENFSDKFKIESIHLYSSIVGDHNPVIRFNLDWSDGKNHYHDMPDFQPHYAIVHDLCKQFHLYNPDYVKQPFKEVISLNDNITQRILDFMLSDELRTIFDYNKMHLELDNSNTENSKKIKL